MSARLKEVIIERLKRDVVSAGNHLYAIPVQTFRDLYDLTVRTKPDAFLRLRDFEEQEAQLTAPGTLAHYLLEPPALDKLFSFFENGSSFWTIGHMLQDAFHHAFHVSKNVVYQLSVSPSTFLDRHDERRIQHSLDVLRNTFRGDAVVDYIENQGIPVEAYRVPSVLTPFINKSGDYKIQSRAIRLFVPDELEERYDTNAWWSEIFAHEQRHDWQFRTEAIVELEVQLRMMTPLANLFITKVIEADALRYGAALGNNTALMVRDQQRSDAKRQYFATSVHQLVEGQRAYAALRTERSHGQCVSAFQFATALLHQDSYHDHAQEHYIRSRSQFAAHWASFVDQIERGDTELGRVAWQFMLAVTQKDGQSYLLADPTLGLGAITNLRAVPPALRPQK